jgi:hypothetical protein
MRPFLLPNIEQSLTSALGIPVQVKFDLSLEDYDKKIIKDRDYDILLIGRSLNYKIQTEILTLVYNKEKASYLDPTGKVNRELARLKTSQTSFEQERITRSILKQMIEDSESIPLHYISNPVFYNSELLETSKASVDESIKLWKISLR